MMEIDLGLYRRARVWSALLKDARYVPTEWLTADVQAEGRWKEAREATTEVFLPRGGRAEYGLLGVKFLPSNSGPLRVRVAISKTTVPAGDWTLAAKTDRVSVGLLPEFGQAVLRRSTTSAVAHLLSSGNLAFESAAYGESGSSANLFGCLTEIVVSLLDPHTVGSEESVRKVLLSKLSRGAGSTIVTP